MSVADPLLRQPSTFGHHQTTAVYVSDLKIRAEQVVEQCAYTIVSLRGGERALTLAGALGTDHRNGAVLPESKQVILGQEILKRLSTRAGWLCHFWQGRAYL